MSRNVSVIAAAVFAVLLLGVMQLGRAQSTSTRVLSCVCTRVLLRILLRVRIRELSDPGARTNVADAGSLKHGRATLINMSDPLWLPIVSSVIASGILTTILTEWRGHRGQSKELQLAELKRALSILRSDYDETLAEAQDFLGSRDSLTRRVVKLAGNPIDLQIGILTCAPAMDAIIGRYLALRANVVGFMAAIGGKGFREKANDEIEKNIVSLKAAHDELVLELLAKYRGIIGVRRPPRSIRSATREPPQR